jgi:predicted naringenin-chalcone synthase
MVIPTYLSNFEVIFPKNRHYQAELNVWVKETHIKAEKLNPNAAYTEKDFENLSKLFDRYTVKETQIGHRYLETSDATNTTQAAEVYKISNERNNGADILDRTLFFSKTADKIFQNTYKSVAVKPDHLIHVTCTGYISPSPAQKVVSQSDWNKSTAVTHAYHMGCYASLPAIRIAQGLMSHNAEENPNFTTDIFHTEMCGLHMNALSQTPEQFIVQSLFADGHIKYTVSAKPTENKKCLKVLAISEQIIPQSQEDMSWVPTSWGLQMNLSREVPAKIRSSIKPFLNALASKANLSITDIENAEFAIHPGGPKIIDTVKEVLELPDQKVTHSKAILFERGNMSSATLPHVWDRMLNQDSILRGTKIISFAFGPGLTVFGSVMEVC